MGEKQDKPVVNGDFCVTCKISFHLVHYFLSLVHKQPPRLRGSFSLFWSLVQATPPFASELAENRGKTDQLQSRLILYNQARVNSLIFHVPIAPFAKSRVQLRSANANRGPVIFWGVSDASEDRVCSFTSRLLRPYVVPELRSGKLGSLIFQPWNKSRLIQILQRNTRSMASCIQFQESGLLTQRARPDRPF